MSFDQSLFEKVVLLALTAVISGFGIPYVLKRIEERRARDQKRFEAELARQGKIIEAQSKLLDDLSRILWQWRYLAKKVVYYGAYESKEQWALAVKQYEEGIWDILNAFRIEISRARRLVSERAFERLEALYEYVVRDIDKTIASGIRTRELDVTASTAMANRFSTEVSGRLDDELDRLAAELKLKVMPQDDPDRTLR